MDRSLFIGIALVAFALMAMLFCLLRKGEEFFNLREVITKHLALFKECPSKYVVFYVLPLVFAVGLSLVYEAGASFYTELSVILGIILSMLFAILSILSSHDFLSVKDEQARERANGVVLETVNAIVFDSVLCLGLMLYGLVIIVLDGVTFGDLPFDTMMIKCVISCIAYYVFTVILLTLLLIVKHMSKIIEFNLKISRGNNP